MRTSKRFQTFAVASVAALALGAAACENGDGVDDNDLDTGVEEPADPDDGVDDGLDEDGDDGLDDDNGDDLDDGMDDEDDDLDG